MKKNYSTQLGLNLAYVKSEITFKEALDIAEKMNKSEEEKKKVNTNYEKDFPYDIGFLMWSPFLWILRNFKSGDYKKLVVGLSLMIAIVWGGLEITGLRTYWFPSACDCANIVKSIDKDRWWDDNGTYHDSDDYWRQVGKACMRKYTNEANWEIEAYQNHSGVISYKAQFAAEKECNN